MEGVVNYKLLQARTRPHLLGVSETAHRALVACECIPYQHRHTNLGDADKQQQQPIALARRARSSAEGREIQKEKMEGRKNVMAVQRMLEQQ
ncbi:hypothetical protein PoB_001929800 [Plakobranchus ocellatus]|uniref:Uncharacterized protein n=1 Tax=Plakobranchus ocellatus TaxID=259542 RepID=A0AAV3ZDI1_9GAST|nr:hypothetical protein PoB_001929800 [Plakobranchus ocellatus]